MRTPLFRTWTSWLLGLAGGVVGIAVTSQAFDWPWATKTGASMASPMLVSDTPLLRESKVTTSFAPIIRQVGPSVVSIYTTKRITRNYDNPFFSDPMFRQFFGDQFGNRSPGARRRPYTETSLGSGVIVSKDGYIISNNHVIDGADEIKVALPGPGKKEYTAKVVGRDERTDVAVLKIDASNLPSMTLADTDKIEVGDVVLAIGNPFGLGQTVTMGIISAVRRGNVGIEDYEDFIQTDAAINPGNSGGALVDGEGRLIGICTAILSRSGGNQGIGFAVPANMARNIMERIMKTGKVTRGFLGVWMQDLTPPLAKALGVSETHGVVVTEVAEKSAAADAGLQERDVILELNGKPFQDGQQFRLAVSQFAPGDKVTLKVLRNKQEKTFEVKLKENPDEKQTASSGEAEESSSESLKGVTVGDIDAAARQQLNLPANLRGALVVEVEPDSAAYEAGLRQGDVILEINQKSVKNAEEAVAATKNLKDKEIVLRVRSRGGSHFLVVDESKKK